MPRTYSLTLGENALDFTIGRSPYQAEVFYLDKDELPESDSGTRLFGINYELSSAKSRPLGLPI